MRILLFLKRGAGTSPCQKIELLFCFISITTPTTKAKLSIPRKSQTKNQMAIPVFQSMSSAEDQRNLLALLITAIYAMVVILTLFAYPEKKQPQNSPVKKHTKKKSTAATTTPVKRQLKTSARKCPAAPKSKRQRLATDADTPAAKLVPRKLFDDIVCEDTVNKQCPDAPFKVVSKKRRTGCTETYNVTTELIFDDADTGAENTPCPDAPRKPKRAKKFVLSKDDATRIAFKFADIRTTPTHKDKFSPETLEMLNSFKQYDSDQYSVLSLTRKLAASADSFDITNPKREMFGLNESAIREYRNSLIAMFKYMENLNNNNIVLPHAGTGELTERNGGISNPYVLVDRMSNAVFGIMVKNTQLVAALNNIYKRNKHNWQVVPDTFAKSCEMCREVQMVSKMLHRELSNNMNRTSWADW